MGRKRKGNNGRRGPARSVRQPGLTGTVRVEGRGRAFIETPEGTFRLTGRGLRGAMNGDVAFASLHRGPGGQRRATVEHVVEHAVKAIVGTYRQLGPLGSVRSLDARIREDFFVLPADDSPRRLGVEPGDIVAARIVSYPNREESGVVTLERLVGDASAPDLGIQMVMARHDLADGYPDAPLAEAEGLALDVEAALADPLRRDIRDRFCLTIDPVDARDFDDAVSVERADADGWRLGVHIADVSHYVAWESAIDLEARRRSTSVYLADRVLPMLPEALSNDLCSLVPGKDRLAFTVDMELDARGRVRAYEMYPSAIRSRVRLDYAAVDTLLEGRAGEAGAAGGAEAVAGPGAASGAEPGPSAAERATVAAREAERAGVDLAAFLHAADELARARRRLRRERGAIDFETVEVHALLGPDRMPERIVNRRRTAATSLIEEAMLLANECVAERLADAAEPAAFRVHEPPAPDHLAAAASTLAGIGAIDRELAGAIEAGDAHAVERAVELVHGTPYEPLANALLLRAMQRALYKPANEGHYALAAPAYLHFTSPIRRYPDLLAHRALKRLLASERLGAREARSRRAALVGTGAQAMERILPQLCRHASERERIADAAAHASQKVKVAQYYGERIGERAAGAVSWIGEAGVFVRLDETGAEGLLRLKDLGGEWWELDERRLTLTGASTGQVIGLGSRMVVEVVAVDVLRGHLDLALVHAGPALH